ncbi:MAG: EamA family transporter [bacterium]
MMSITTIALLCMLGSAFTHAVMNMLNKAAQDKVLFRGLFVAVMAVVVLPFAFFLPLPTPTALKHLFLAALLHGTYTTFLISAFKKGDLGLVYPIMRGLAPLLAAGFAFFFLKEALSVTALIALIGAMVTLIAFAIPEKGGTVNRQAIIYALLSAVMIAAYTVNDAAGVRANGHVGSYFVWFYIIAQSPVAITCLYLRRDHIARGWRREIKMAMISSTAGIATFLLALYGLSMAPVANMSALRETSVVFGAFLAALVLKEPLGQRRVVLATLLALCLIALQLG